MAVQTYDKEFSWLLNEKHSGIFRPEFLKDAFRLKQGEPIDYLIGFVEFLGCKIDLSKRSLIPRIETEFWVEKAIADIKKSVPESAVCLDLFAGSGCIGFAVLKHIYGAQVDFADINIGCLQQVVINANCNGILSDRYRIIRSDAFGSIKGKYDYIFANPPYLARVKSKSIQPSVLRWEPPDALWGGEDGLRYIRILLRDARKYLKTKGKIYFEFDDYQKDDIEKILFEYGYNGHQFFKDQFGKWRYAVAE